MAAAFIIYIHPQLETDQNEESADLLRVLLYTMNSTIFGGDVPEIPNSTGPRDGVVTALILLYLDLTLTMSCVVFALFTKQLLTIFTMTGLLGSIAGKGQNQQVKLKWFTVGLRVNFLILSEALLNSLLYLDCAIIVYLWDINRALATFVLYITIGITLLWFFFCVLAGVAYFILSRHVSPLATQIGSSGDTRT
jgi:hypothetical protein